MENLMMRLFTWAENSYEPLQSYATGLLAAAMDVQEIANVYRYSFILLTIYYKNNLLVSFLFKKFLIII